MGGDYCWSLYDGDGYVYGVQNDLEQAVTDDLSYVVMSNMPIPQNPQNQESIGPLDKLLAVIRYKTTVLRGCLGFGISSGSGVMGQTPDIRENLCSLL